MRVEAKEVRVGRGRRRRGRRTTKVEVVGKEVFRCCRKGERK